ncbi:MAG: phosphoribosyltransferase family protein [Patescibacteria group bacterium]
MYFLKTILSIIFPEHCLVCNKNDVVLCLDCATELPRGFSPDQKILVVFDYSDRRVKKAIKLFKYGNRRSLAKVFAELVYNNTLLEELSELRLTKNFTEALLVPIPISGKRFRERGYNQMELVGRELASLDGGASFSLAKNILLKTRNTESQVKTGGKSERLKNLKGSFEVAEKVSVRGRNIILIDDVVTTGATLAEARKVLKKAGARQILSVAIAH